LQGLTPLALHSPGARHVVEGFLGAWVATELLARIPRLHIGIERRVDPTRVVISVSLGGGFALAIIAARHRLWMFGGGWASIAVGLAISAVGVALRTWAIVTLGRFFSYDVTIQPGHHVVTSGPYRWVRHPSYTGGLVALLGLGITLGSSGAVLAITGLPLVGVLIRIHYEERTLLEALDGGYEAYAGRTSRLIPGIW
jgi:protein-S-isoprenylcysteine O-methyltransferase Ste14